MHLIFDTETTGKFNFKLPTTHETQPHIVQFAMVLLDESFNEIMCFNSLVKPKGWTIEKEAQDVHGISLEQCEKYGIPIDDILYLFTRYHNINTTLVAHNIKFDSRMIEREAFEMPQDKLVIFIGNQFCTMNASTDILKLKGPIPGKYKWPKLQETYTYYYGKPFDEAHDALADCRACAAVYKKLVSI